MKIAIRRSAMPTATATSGESLAEAITITDVHALLYRRGEIDVADRLTATLTSREACALASRLRRLVRRTGRARFFRDYRSTLPPADAERLGLVALWYERAGRAGCRVWADLREDSALTPSPSHAPTATGADASTASMPLAPMLSDPSTTEPTQIMPDWLTAPESSVWNA